jgi:O-antigen/teichoic acid export membrane protein
VRSIDKIKALTLQFLQHKVVQNFSYLTISSVLSQVISLLTVLKITSVLLPSDYGLYTFLMVQGTLLVTIGDLGTGNIIIRSIAREQKKTNDLAFNSGILRLVALLLLSIIYVIYNYFLGSLTGTQLALLFAFSAVNVLFRLSENIFLGYQKMFIPSLVGLLYSVFWLTTIYVLPKDAYDATTLFTAFLALNALKAGLMFFFLHSQKLFVGKIHGLLESSKDLLRQSWPYFMMVLIMVPFNHFSNNYPDINSTSEEVGYYNLALRLIGPLSLVIGFALSAIFPNLSAMWVEKRDQYYRFVGIGFRYFMIVALLACFLFTLFIGDLVTLLFSEEYLPAIRICQLHVWYTFLTSIDSLMGTILGSINREKLILRFGIIYLIVCTPALYFGSKFGALGLSLSYVFSFGICQIYVWQVFRKVTKLQISNSTVIWGLAIVAFVVSNGIPLEHTFIYRLVLALVVLAFSGWYFYRVFHQKFLA